MLFKKLIKKLPLGICSINFCFHLLCFIFIIIIIFIILSSTLIHHLILYIIPFHFNSIKAHTNSSTKSQSLASLIQTKINKKIILEKVQYQTSSSYQSKNYA